MASTVEDEMTGPTLVETAEEAGVSVSTLSKVLHNRSDVSSKTRAKVQRLVERHGYLARHRPASRRCCAAG
jgi:DNA-binding LacI/PurR family transcriptional regulator